ncbi:MAG TPA: hypothetical protein VE757_00650 [Gaiellaceae bacterium]|nr:hypothetical protein [Gaiellaceae bacterium]
MRNRRAAPILALFALLAGLSAIVAAAPATAHAATPCWQRVINQWLDNKPIATTYKPSCYQQALKHVPEDLRDYSDITDAISAALQASLRGDGGSSGPGATTPAGTGTQQSDSGHARTTQGVVKPSAYRQAIDKLGTTKADSLPIPLLVLAGLGTALLVSAGALAAHKRLRSRPRPPV